MLNTRKYEEVACLASKNLNTTEENMYTHIPTHTREIKYTKPGVIGWASWFTTSMAISPDDGTLNVHYVGLWGFESTVAINSCACAERSIASRTLTSSC